MQPVVLVAGARSPRSSARVSLPPTVLSHRSVVSARPSPCNYEFLFSESTTTSRLIPASYGVERVRPNPSLQRTRFARPELHIVRRVSTFSFFVDEDPTHRRRVHTAFPAASIVRW